MANMVNLSPWAKSLITVNMDIIDIHVDKYAQYIKTEVTNSN